MLKKYYKKILTYIAAPITIGLLIVLMTFPKGIFQLDILSYVAVYAYSIGIPYMLGSEIIESKLEKRIRWLEKPLKRFLVTALLETAWAIILILLIHYFFFFRIRGDNLPILYERTLSAFFYATFFIVLSIMTKNTAVFLRNWKQSAVNEEKLKREILTAEYEALKNQVNPHFLFNNLTALSSLVYKDQDKAARFINQLADVYRYILEYGNDEVVTLEAEKKLLDNLVYLYKIRYGNGLTTQIEIPGWENRYIIPMALQILFENAVKHNSFSPEEPLNIKIRHEGGYILVKNNLQPKTTVKHSGKLGLKNIQLRYKYLTDKEIFIKKTATYFQVKIPVLNKKP